MSIMRPLMRMRLARIADGLAIAVAVSLPWSTSATTFLLLLWLVALLPSLDPASVRQEIARPAGGLPVALVALAALGMAWADVGWSERLGGLDSFLKLLIIPLLLAQFRRSDRGLWVMGGYLVSCTALLAASATSVLWPWIILASDRGVPMKTVATQSGEFVICAYALLFIAIEAFRQNRPIRGAAVLTLAFLFLADVFYVTTAPTVLLVVPFTALVITPLLLVLLGFKKFSPKSTFVLLVIAATLGIVSWISSPHLQSQIATMWENIQPHPGDERNWAGSRPEFWKKSLSFIGEAPVFGHGTGSIPKLFARSAVGQTGIAAQMTANPHQQTFAVGIQLGLVGIAVLWAMWISHLLLFRGNGLPEWIGLVVVIQFMVSAMLDSTLFNFTEGWAYVFGVGVTGGVVSRPHAEDDAAIPQTPSGA